jgi:hypothetical protein
MTLILLHYDLCFRFFCRIRHHSINITVKLQQVRQTLVDKNKTEIKNLLLMFIISVYFLAVCFCSVVLKVE